MNKSNTKNRIAIVNLEKCKPNKCNQECKTFCPVESTGKECVNIVSDIEDMNVSSNNNKEISNGKKHAQIIESACIACTICVKKCPFDAIRMVNIPSEVGGMIIHRYSPNSFRLYRMPIMKTNIVLGILGSNGIGKSTVMQILSNKIKPNFEEFKNPIKMDKDIVSKFKGTEMHKFMEMLYAGDIDVSIKPQHVETLIKVLNVKKLDPTVEEYIAEKSDYINIDSKYVDVIKTLELDQILSSKVKTLSGGELQRLVCSVVLLKKADLYIFDEPSNYLDIKQRLNMAKLIRSLVSHDKYVVVIEHDLSLLDYISDQICIMYGEPGAFGVVSKPISTAEAINIYFDGYIPSENMRFRLEEYNIKDISSMQIKQEENTINHKVINYVGGEIKYPKFNLKIEDGTFPSDSAIIVILGENGTGKSCLIKYLADQLNSQVSYKPQYLTVDQFILKDGTYPTVEQFLYNTIQTSYTSELFRTDVLRPMQIPNIKDRLLNELSGGEMQRLWITYCLGKSAFIYLLDEPSACLDVEQRVITTKVIKRFIEHNHKIAFVVEHDMMMSVNLASSDTSQIIVMTKEIDDQMNRICIAEKPISFKNGINKFLKSLDITFRTESTYSKHSRPRINKLGSTKDREQKQADKYYQ
jgi:ATP-binding cassette subfamily E protein 1